MYINSLQHHEGELPEKIKDLGLNYFLFYEVFLYYLARNKGKFDLRSDDFYKVVYLIKTKSRCSLKEINLFIQQLADLGAWDYDQDNKIVKNEYLVKLSGKFSKAGRKAQENKKQSLQVQETEIKSVINKTNNQKLGKYQSNSDLVNRLIEFNLQANHNAYKSIIDYERLVTKINPDTLKLYMDNVELFKKASINDTGTNPAFKNGYFRVMNEFKKAVDSDIDLKPVLPEWVKVVNGVSTIQITENKPSDGIPEGIKFREHIPENWKDYFWIKWKDGLFNWGQLAVESSSAIFHTKLVKDKVTRDKFYAIHTGQEWIELFTKWFGPSGLFPEMASEYDFIYRFGFDRLLSDLGEA